MVPTFGAGMFAILLFLIALYSLDNRRPALKLILGCVIYLIVSIPTIILAENIRYSGFAQLAEHSRPLTDAINQFETEYGKPPESLQQLVSEFLPKVPQTGIGALPNYEYQVLTDQRFFKGNQWFLRVEAQYAARSDSFLVYFPDQNYLVVYSASRIQEIGHIFTNHII